MILCHGTESFNRHLSSMKPFLEEYYKMGISLFLFDFTGYGESGGKGEFNHSQRVADISSVLERFKHKYKKIVLCGISLGTISAAIAATKYKEITGLYLVNGYYDLLLTYPRFYLQTLLGYFLNQEIRIETIYAWKHLRPERIKIPTLIVAGAKDQIVNPKQSINFYNKLACEKKLIIAPDGVHALTDQRYIQEFLPEVKQWILQ